ncbi:MAG TPA: DUF4190 domain-containing protein [Sphingomicrobium sp.]|nr:DUF4190 domain-containing protein [Sphingomicrobium sp.]
MATVSESHPPTPDHNALGKAAFVLGLLSLVLSFIPIVGFVSWLLAPLGIIFGLIALRRPSRSLAIVGIVTGVIALFVCYSWVKGTQAVTQAISSDTFNNDGTQADNSSAPIINASVKGLWKELEDNKIAAGKKYGGHRLVFTDERIHDFGGTATDPSMDFLGKEDEFLVHYVTATFSAADGQKIGTLKKGQKISFVCRQIGETFGEGYSLSNCSLK